VPIAICPECETDVFVEADSEQGSIVICDECHTSLELVGLDPIELDVRAVDDDLDDYADDDVNAYIYDE
jgi:lysine biosynthesis protein LysW